MLTLGPMARNDGLLSAMYGDECYRPPPNPVPYLYRTLLVLTIDVILQKMSPEIQRKVDANRARWRAARAAEQATQQQADAQLNDPDSAKPIWADRPTRS
ncbi:hypothetical protein WOLCODRAFT_149557 [Wolfiporia cocos MD-104 SS10]|uniref:Uncharacterized protein n=1 Tax=Wolfiporia cocos (strain MD-104) TaxID=742152 RepID=A0A2H3J8R7_WOLCO|nr:hypothetical protein WOLCODRAFT_149557 [Wolfiporia cocos MD-104 SS10]